MSSEMNLEEREILIGLYLDEALDEEQLKQVDELLATDAVFAKSLAQAELFDVKLERVVGREAQAAEILKQLQPNRESDGGNGRRRRAARAKRDASPRILRPILYVAAAIAAAVIIAVLTLDAKDPSRPPQRVARNGSTPMPRPATKSDRAQEQDANAGRRPEEDRKPGVVAAPEAPTDYVDESVRDASEDTALADASDSRETLLQIDESTETETTERLPARIASIAAVDGEVQYEPAPASGWVEARAGMELASGARVRTRLSRAIIAVAGGGSLLLNRNTVVEFATSEGQNAASVIVGEVLCSFSPGDAELVVKTPHGVLSEIAGRIDVRIAPARTTLVSEQGSALIAVAAGTARLLSDQQIAMVEGSRGLPQAKAAVGTRQRFAWANDLAPSDRGRASPDAAQTVARLPVPKTGRFNGILTHPETAETVIRYAAWVPSTLPEHGKLGLVVVFHGATSDENTMIDGYVQSLQRAGVHDRHMVLSGKSKTGPWRADDDEAVSALIDWALLTYPIDKRRLILTGISAGGDYPAHWSASHKNAVAGVASYDRSQRWPSGADVNTAHYITCGDQDEAVDACRRARTALSSSGHACVYREFDGLAHGATWYVSELQSDICRWMAFQRNDHVPLEKGDREFVLGLSERSAAEASLLDPQDFQRITSIGGSILAKAIASGLRSTRPQARTAAATACSIADFGKTAAAALCRATLKEKDPGTLEAMLHAVGTLANWRHLQAQETLVKMATLKKPKLEARIQAIRQIARAVELPIRGNFEDAILFQTLVRLLADDQIEIRKAAFEPLAAARDDAAIITVTDDFGYSPKLPANEQKDAINAWWQWCQTSCGKP